MARPQEGHNPALSEHNAPQPEQVTMRTDCIPPQEAPVKPLWPNTPDLCRQFRLTACASG
jgi:hypothetical protein